MLVSLLHPGDLGAADWVILLLAWVVFPVAIIYTVASYFVRRRKVTKLFDDDDNRNK